MIFFTDPEKFPKCKTSVFIGNFDGVHLGHKKIIEVASSFKNDDESVKTCLVTFSPHPREFFSPDFVLPKITSQSEKLDILEKLGVDFVLSLDFKQYFSMEPEEFLNFLKKSLNPIAITVGFNFFFGKNQSGNTDFLFWWSKSSNMKVKIVPPVVKNGIRISSSIIRTMLLQGDVKTASSLLTFPYFVSGKVVKGRQIGRELAFPTINIIPPEKLIPPDGVYATKVKIGEIFYVSITNIGNNPTIDSSVQKRMIETYVIDQKLPEIYEKDVEICFFYKIRNEIKFSSKEKLKMQIKKDVEKTKEFFANLDFY